MGQQGPNNKTKEPSPCLVLFLFGILIICFILLDWTTPKHFSALVAPIKDIEQLEVLTFQNYDSSTSIPIEGDLLDEILNVLDQSAFIRKRAPEINALEGRLSYFLIFKVQGRIDDVTMIITNCGNVAINEKNKWYLKQYEIQSPINILSFLDSIVRQG